MKRLRDIHDNDYLNDLHKMSVHGRESLDKETPLMGKSFEIARFGAGGVLDAVDQIMEHKIPSALCLTAMPGHHAGVSSFGYGSLINPAAAGAQYLSKKYRMKRIVIIDLDGEHGAGTQEIFWHRRDVMVVSLHEYPGQAGTGHYSEVGEKSSNGFNINVPLPSGYGDREYRVAWKEIIFPIMAQFQPEIFILSFGTNALAEDPSTHLILSEEGLLSFVTEILRFCRKYSGGRVLSVLEGGTPGHPMSRAVSQHASLLLNSRMPPADSGKKAELISYSDWYVYAKLLKTLFRKFWKL